MPNDFQAVPAVRGAVPVLLGLYGPSGSGKTFSSLRVAAGMQRVTGKPTFLVDTENGRGRHYAPKRGEHADGVNTFDYQYVPFEPPFSSERYTKALAYCTERGAGQIIIDSGSHEHEGEGGLLDSHAAYVESKGMNSSMMGWQIVKRPHDKLRTAIARSQTHQIWCFRGKEKLRPAERNAKDREPKKLGMMPIAGSDLLFELTLSGLLMPGSKGVALWQSKEPGEHMMVKVPRQFEALTAQLQGPLSEELGEALARWGAGDSAPPKPADKPTAKPVLKFHPDYDKSLAGMPLAETSATRVLDYIEWLRPNDNPKAQEHLRQVEDLYEKMLAAEAP